MKCECAEPGFCERHKCNKSIALFRKCEEGGKYWDAWEAGRGPMQDGARSPRLRVADKKCVHLGKLIGGLACGCGGKPAVYQCNLLDKPCMATSLSKPWSASMNVDVKEKPVSCGICDFKQLEQVQT